MATAEFAVAMPAFLFVLVLAISGIGAGVTHLRVTDAAGDMARAIAVGQSNIDQIAAQAGVQVSVSRGGDDMTCVEASAPVSGPLGWAGLRAQSRACAWNLAADHASKYAVRLPGRGG